MATKTVFILALAFAQVLTEYAEVGFVEDVDIKVESAQSRIVSGWEAEPGQHPHQVSVRMVSDTGEVSSCGGSVIHHSIVLTAAHCTAMRVTLVIRAGVNNLTTPEYISESTEYYNHPTYNNNLPQVVQPNDIGVIKLFQKLVFSKYLQPIRLQSSADAFRNYHNHVVYASGYGRTWTLGATPEVLNWVYLRAVSNPTCFSTFGSIITDNTICAQFYNVTSQSVCQGDSGGPLVHVDPAGVPILIGIASFVAGGDFGCHSGLPGGFIRTGPFHSWLKEVTFIDFEEEESTTTTTTSTTPKPDSDEDPTDSSEPSRETSSSENSQETKEEPDDSKEKESREDSSSDDSKEKESGEDSSSDDSCDDSDPDLSQLLKRLEVKVKVKVKVDKFKKKHVVHKKH